ncbi:uncharacterized protein LOC135149434 [Daucus carota subsp. sativus]|uniref:uncharacterized protein LOC135149434 n=1 Tax=Daucus carota subsp. sativus TaxID=79200 RepID=UPI00308368BC
MTKVDTLATCMPNSVNMNDVHLPCGRVGCMQYAMNMMSACFTMLNASFSASSTMNVNMPVSHVAPVAKTTSPSKKKETPNSKSKVKRELVRGLPQKVFCQEGLCDACEKGKSKKASHISKCMTGIGSPLQLIHMDLFGPVNIPSILRKRYALVIVDDYSKYIWVLFLHTKDEAAQVIIDHIKKIEKEANLPARAIRSDNGTIL